MTHVARSMGRPGMSTAEECPVVSYHMCTRETAERELGAAPVQK